MRDRSYMLTGMASSTVLSVVLIASSLLKAVNVHSFATEVMLFSQMYVASALAPFSVEIACTVCALELLLSLLLLRGRHKIAASVLSVVLLSFFVVLTGLNQFAPPSIGSIESCGCFGELVHFSPLGSFVKSLVLWCVSILCLMSLCKDQHFHMCTRKTYKDMLLDALVFLLMSVAPPTFSLLCMEHMSAEVYMSVYVVVCAAIVCYAVGGVMSQMRDVLRIDSVLYNQVRKGGVKITELKK